MITKTSVIIPSFRSKALTLLCIRGIEKFKGNIDVKFIVVENSDDESYKDEVLEAAENVKWITNPTKQIGSLANAEAIIVGLKEVETDWVFLVHCDTFVFSPLFFNELSKKVEEGYKMVGTGLDQTRIKACHISGVFVQTDIAKKINMYPTDGGRTLDVGDDITRYCREYNIKHYCFRNTFNSPELINRVNDNFRYFQVDRCLNDNNEVMFMHLGRGIPKIHKTYSKNGRVDIEGWVDFCEKIIND